MEANDIVFTCAICGAKHPSVENLPSGVAKLPDTITTTRKGGKFIFLCTSHEQVKEKDPQAEKQRCYGNDNCGYRDQENIPRSSYQKI
jgi:hypothetical protein